jgi:hypothetical protein
MRKILASVVAVLGLAVSAAAQTAPPSVIGEWELTTLSPVGESTNTVEFKMDGEVFKAFAKSQQGERPYDSASIVGDKVSLVLTIDYQGQPMTISYLGTVTENEINGSADFGGLAQGSFSAKRKDAPPKP